MQLRLIFDNVDILNLTFTKSSMIDNDAYPKKQDGKDHRNYIINISRHTFLHILIDYVVIQ